MEIYASWNTLDLILSDSPQHVYDSNILDQTYSSDHYFVSIVFEIHSLIPGSSPVPTFNFNRNEADWAGLSDYLLDKDFLKCCSPNDIDKAWLELKTIIDACHKFDPIS